MNLLRGIDLHKRIAGKDDGRVGAECKGVCSEAGMFALRERRIHVTHEATPEMAVAGHCEGAGRPVPATRSCARVLFGV